MSPVLPSALLVAGLTAGLLAGGASCAAVQGGLLAGAVTRRSRVLAGAGDAPAREPRSSAETESSVLLPTGVFLAGKLVSHTALGALLGVFGAVLQPGPQAQAVLLLASAVLMVLFALDLMGVRAVAGLVPRPPASWGRLVRRGARIDSVLTPAVLGFLTVLVPCGVTLSMGLLAVTSGSALGGAAVMAGFVLGTVPLFAGLGYLLRKSTTVLRGRLSVATGVVVLVIALVTAGSGLRLGGWLPDLSGGGSSTAAAVAEVDAGGVQRIVLQVADTSYTPDRVTARAGVPTSLVLRTDGTRGCTRAFVIPSLGFRQVLPESGDTTVELAAPAPGVLAYTCSMGMYSGQIEFTGGPA